MVRCRIEILNLRLCHLYKLLQNIFTANRRKKQKILRGLFLQSFLLNNLILAAARRSGFFYIFALIPQFYVLRFFPIQPTYSIVFASFQSASISSSDIFSSGLGDCFSTYSKRRLNLRFVLSSAVSGSTPIKRA